MFFRRRKFVPAEIGSISTDSVKSFHYLSCSFLSFVGYGLVAAYCSLNCSSIAIRELFRCSPMSYANANSPASAVQSPGANCTKYEKKTFICLPWLELIEPTSLIFGIKINIRASVGLHFSVMSQTNQAELGFDEISFTFSRRFRKKIPTLTVASFFRQFNAIGPLFVH